MPVFLDRLSGLLPPPSGEGDVGARRLRARCARSSARCVGVAEVRATVLLTGETGVGKEVCGALPPCRRAAPPGPSWRSTARRSPPTCWRRSCSATSAAPSPARRRAISATPSGPATARCSSTRSATSRRRCRRSCCASSRSAQFHRVGGETPVAVPRAHRLRDECRSRRSACATGRFREDLFYRINVISVDRAAACASGRTTSPGCSTGSSTSSTRSRGRPCAASAALAEEAALAHAWPGNVRELRNRVERAVALALGPWLMPGDLFPESCRRELDMPAALPSLEEARLPPSGGISSARWSRPAARSAGGEGCSASPARRCGRRCAASGISDATV